LKIYQVVVALFDADILYEVDSCFLQFL